MTKQVWIKNIPIGGGAPITVQSMTNTRTADYDATFAQIRRLEELGCDLVRVSVPDEESVLSLKKLVLAVNCPIIADIHYDYRLALGAIEAGAHKVRLNPSNLTKAGLKEVARAARERKIPLRVGVNQGSLTEAVTPERLAELTADTAKLLEDEGVTNLVLAVKSSDVYATIRANRALSRLTEYPLHIGLTEAGTANLGAVKSAIAIGSLLADGIGDTLRVSLSGAPENEVVLGKKILGVLGLSRSFAEVVACPTCARTNIPVESIALELEARVQCVKNLKKPLKIAVMGCTVNGIGESRGADFGVCGGAEKSIIFKNGAKLKTVENSQIIPELLKLLGEYDG